MVCCNTLRNKHWLKFLTGLVFGFYEFIPAGILDVIAAPLPWLPPSPCCYRQVTAHPDFEELRQSIKSQVLNHSRRN